MTKAIGIIGVGEIASAIVDGLCEEPGAAAPQIWLSPRNAVTAAELARRHPSVQVCETNQSVAEHASLLLVTVRPDVAADVLAGLRVGDDTVVVSAVAGMPHACLRRHLGEQVAMVRAIPLPAVRRRQGITALYPAHPQVEALFDRLGDTLTVASAEAFAALSATSATIAAHLHYLDTIAAWASDHGLDRTAAERYLRGVFGGVADGLAEHMRSLGQLADAHATPGGINAELRRTWFDEENTAALRDALGAIYRRVTADSEGTHGYENPDGAASST